MIIQIEIIIITKLYHKLIRKMFMEAKAQIQDKFLIQNKTIIMITSSTMHQTNMKILKHSRIKVFFQIIILSNKNIIIIIMIH
jgi:hypothetical protein